MTTSPGSRCPESPASGIHIAATRSGPIPIALREVWDSICWVVDCSTACRFEASEPGPVSALTGNEMHNQNPRIPMREGRAHYAQRSWSLTC